jgi:hypothetical protein
MGFFLFFFKLGNGSSGVQQEFLEWEKNKQQKLDEYHARKLEIYNTMINKQEEMITLQRRTTIALEALVSSPVIKF